MLSGTRMPLWGSHARSRARTPLSDSMWTQEASVKTYAVYEDAWWGTKLGLWEGEVRETSSDPPVYIRFHDGPLRCAGARGARGHVHAQIHTAPAIFTQRSPQCINHSNYSLQSKGGLT